jgi:hypothetical protein
MTDNKNPVGQKFVRSHGTMDGLHEAAKLRPSELQNGLQGATALKPSSTPKTPSPPPPTSKTSK